MGQPQHRDLAVVLPFDHGRRTLPWSAGFAARCSGVLLGRRAEGGVAVPQQVRGVVAHSKGEPVSLETIIVPGPRARARRWCRSRPAGCATPTCTTARAASTTSSRSCSGTRRPDRGVGRRGRHRRGARRLRDPQLAGGLRHLPGLPARRALVLLRHPQRRPEDDPGSTAQELSPALGIGAFAEKTLVARRAVHEGRPGGAAGGRRAARLRGDGRHRRGDQHRRGRPRRLGRGHRLRRRRRRGDRRRPAGRRRHDHRRRHRRPEAGAGPRSSAPRTRSTPASTTRSRRSRR